MVEPACSRPPWACPAPAAIAAPLWPRSASSSTFSGLSRYRDHYISDLSTGTRRVVELAGLLAHNAKVLCLDEPTAGLAQRETEAFGPLITTIQKELAASVLLIEHDMPLIMGISQRVYCLEAGKRHRRRRTGRGAQRPQGHRQLPRH